MDIEAETTQTEMAEAVSEAVLEVVEEKVASEERAAEVTEQIIDAAIEGERGRRIVELEGEISRCHLRAEETESSLLSLSAAVTELTTRLLTMEASLMTLLALSTPPASSPPLSEKEEADPVKVQVENLDPPKAEEPEKPAPVVKKRRKTFL